MYMLKEIMNQLRVDGEIVSMVWNRITDIIELTCSCDDLGNITSNEGWVLEAIYGLNSEIEGINNILAGKQENRLNESESELKHQIECCKAILKFLEKYKDDAN